MLFFIDDNSPQENLKKKLDELKHLTNLRKKINRDPESSSE